MSFGCSRYVREVSPTAPIWLDDKAIEAVACAFPRSHGVARSDDRTILSAIVYVLRTDILWRALPDEYGVAWRTVYNRFVRWTKLGVMDQIFSLLTIEHEGQRVLAVDADALLTNSTGEVWVDRGYFPLVLGLTGDV